MWICSEFCGVVEVVLWFLALGTTDPTKCLNGYTICSYWGGKPKVFLLGDCDDRIDDLQEEMKALKGTFANKICELQKDLLLLVKHRLLFEKSFIKIVWSGARDQDLPNPKLSWWFLCSFLQPGHELLSSLWSLLFLRPQSEWDVRLWHLR